MPIETATNRVLKLPLDSAFVSRDDQSHSHDHGLADAVEQHENEHRQSHHQQDESEHFDPVSLTASVPSEFGSVHEDNPIANGAENGKASPMKKNQDSSLTAAAAAAVASIQDVWSENFNEPLPTNKEERIQQALEFMHSEKQAHESDKNIKKHSIRQIALFFQVPKSTLYDRLKSKNNDIHASCMPKSLSHRDSGPSTRMVSSSRAHQQQMKLSIEKEDSLLNEVRNLCHSSGNTLNYTQIREYIMSFVDGITLGKKWIHNFTRRHDDHVVYGSYNSRFNIKMKRSKSCRCNFDYLWKCFIPLLQEKIKSMPSDKPFYYITRTCIHQSSMSSVFTCFEINPSDMSLKLLSPPRLILFPDYFGKIYLHQHPTSNGDNVTNTSKHSEVNINMNHSSHEARHSKESGDNSDHNNSNGRSADYEAGSPTSDLVRDEDDTNVINGAKIGGASDHPPKINRQERNLRQFKGAKLNEIFSRLYASCCQQSTTGRGHEGPLVIFEGFDDRYNWDTLVCKDIVQTDKFLALPWNQRIFQQSVATTLQEIVESVAQSSSIRAIESESFETELDGESLNLDLFSQELNLVLNLQTELVNNSENQEQDSLQLNDLNVFEPALHAAAAAAAAVASTTSSNREQDDHLDKTSRLSHIGNVASANIFEDSAVSQLQDVIHMIDSNESQLYRDLVSPNSKTTLMNIFNKIKGIVPQ